MAPQSAYYVPAIPASNSVYLLCAGNLMFMVLDQRKQCHVFHGSDFPGAFWQCEGVRCAWALAFLYGIKLVWHRREQRHVSVG